MESSKMPAVMDIDECVFDNTVQGMKDFDFFKGASNSELFHFAFALGAAHGMEVPIVRKRSGGFARTESFSPKLISAIIALHVEKEGAANPDVVCNQAAAFAEAGRYANGGFQLIEGDLKGNPTAETYANRLLNELDKKYDRIKHKPTV